MKAAVIKEMGKDFATENDMKLINLYTRKKLTSDDVYVFSLVLCDNDIDRDCERFTVESLFALEKLFVGKSGIFDHNPTAQNQCARVFSCKVESVDGKKTKNGDDYFRLTAKAYIPKTAKNEELINLLESGILKEVSVGCSVTKTLCSICGNDINSPGCNHKKGETYNGKLCYGELIDPVDAYEFSFVAIPAQTQAGVIKNYKATGKDMNMDDIIKAIKKGEAVSLTKKDCEKLGAYIEQLKELANDGVIYKNGLKSSIMKLSAMAQPKLSYDTVKSIVEKLSITELKELNAVYEEKAGENGMPSIQLAKTPKTAGNNKNTQFTI